MHVILLSNIIGGVLLTHSRQQLQDVFHLCQICLFFLRYFGIAISHGMTWLHVVLPWNGVKVLDSGILDSASLESESSPQ